MKQGFCAVFEKESEAVEAVKRLKGLGLHRIEAYSPIQSEELESAVGRGKPRLGVLALLAGVIGAASAYWLQWYTQSVAYPLRVGGRPNHAPLAFVPISFETAVLFAGIAIFIGALVLTGLPLLYRPEFEARDFERSMLDAFVVTVESTQKQQDGTSLEQVLRGLGATTVSHYPVEAR